MTLFIVSVAVVIGVSAICSLTEAALYAVRRTYVRQLAESGLRAGHLLTRFKQNMERPITAILIANTAANTAGAAVAGAQARHLFGEAALVWFSVAFTVSVLFLSEIIPKVIGVTYNRPVARFMSGPLNLAIVALHPLVWIGQLLARVLRPSDAAPMAPEEEVQQFAAMSAEEGSILGIEAELVTNVLRLNEVKARDIMTPRTVVFKLPADLTVREVSEQAAESPHARIPIYESSNPENWTGVVLRGDVLARLARDEFDATLDSIRKPLGFVPEAMPGHRLLNEFIKRREHLLAVVDEYGSVMGVVAL